MTKFNLPVDQDFVERAQMPANLADNDGLEMTSFNADGTIAEYYKGPSSRQLWHEHVEGNCVGMCPYCYDEAERYLEKLAMDPNEVRSPPELFRDMKRIVPPVVF